MGYGSIGGLMDGDVVGYGQGGPSFFCLLHKHHKSPSPPHYLLNCFLSLFPTLSFCLRLYQPLLWPTAMSMSNFFPLVLFIFHFLSHLFCLTPSVYLDSLSPPPFAFYRLSPAPPSLPIHPIPFPPKLLFSMDTAVVLFRLQET